MRTKSNIRTHPLTVSGYMVDGTGKRTAYSQRTSIRLADTVNYGDNFPDWRYRLFRQTDTTTTLVGHRASVFADYSGEFYVQDKANGSPRKAYCTGPLANGQAVPILASEITDTVADQRARSKFLAEYIKATRSFGGGNFLAEVRDSIELVLHPVHSMYSHTWDFAKKVKRLGPVFAQRPKTAAKMLSDLWLAFSFGVKPFVQDANDAARAFNVISSSLRSELRPIKGTGHTDKLVSAELGSPISGFDRTDLIGCLRVDNIYSSVSLKGAIHARPYGMGNLLQEFGVGVYDIVPAIWEGIPWSFFIDYFTNVGEVLDSFRLWNAEMAWMKRTVRNRADRVYIPHATKQTDPTSEFKVRGGAIGFRDVYVNRRPANVALDGMPAFNFKLPGLSPQRWLNITALIGVINDSHWGSFTPPRRPRLNL